VALFRGEVREGHSERATNLCIQMVDPARETVRRKPLGQRIRIQECAIDTLGWGAQYTVKTNGASSHDALSPFVTGFPVLDSSKKRVAPPVLFSFPPSI
jgi:hypothetical protein